MSKRDPITEIADLIERLVVVQAIKGEVAEENYHELTSDVLNAIADELNGRNLMA